MSVGTLDALRPGAPTSAAAGLAGLAGPLLDAGVAILYDLAEDRVHAVSHGVADRDRVLAEAALRALCSAALGARAPVFYDDARRELPPSLAADAAGTGFVAFAGVPLRAPCGERLGVLGVVDDDARAWSARELDLLLSLAPGVAAALDHPRIAAALVESDARHRRLLATCPLAIYNVDGDGRILEGNRAAADLAGRGEGELIGRSIREVVAPEDLELVFDALEGTLSGRDGPSQLEFRIVRPTGERRLVQVTRAAVERDGEIVGVQGIGRDVTDERAREAQFRRVERMASVAPLLSGVCHELNNPLTSIKSFAEFLLLDERSEEDREALEIVAREAERAARIVAELRVVARQSQEASATRATVDLNQLVERVADSRRATLAAAGIDLRLDLEPALPLAWAVRAQIEQALAHLLTNAVQAVRDRPEPRLVAIATYPGDLGVVVQIADTGTGIAAEDQNRIFDPFWTTRAPGEGTGLGLSLVHSIVTDHGGRIRVDSAPGRGATFTLDLPAADEAPALGDAEISAQLPARHGLRVLIVDDEAPIRTSLGRYLERRGHRIEQAADGGAALQLLGVSTNPPPFDIIIADLRMPGLDGERFVAKLRERSDGLERRVVFITGDAESPDVEGFLREAGAPVVWKPFELAEVAQIVEAYAGMTA